VTGPHFLYIIWFFKKQQLVRSQTDTNNIQDKTQLLWDLAGNNNLYREIKSMKCKNLVISLCLIKYYMIKIYEMWRYYSSGTRLSWVTRCFMSVFPAALHRTFTLFIPCIMTKWKTYVTPTNALFNNLCILSYT
jgi:hypothetical protein